MSISTSHNVFCDYPDGCGMWVATEHTVRKARKIAKLLGWARVKIDDRVLDLCPEHAKVEHWSDK